MIKFFNVSFVSMVCLCLTGCWSRDASPETTNDETPPLSTAELVLEGDHLAPGGSVDGFIRLHLAEGWHTYSDPPGDSGMAPIIQFKVPPGWQAEILPLPPAKRFEGPEGITFGYENNLDIRFRVRAPSDAQATSSVDVSVNIQWLICQEICLPMSAELRAVLKIAKQ